MPPPLRCRPSAADVAESPQRAQVAVVAAEAVATGAAENGHTEEGASGEAGTAWGAGEGGQVQMTSPPREDKRGADGE